MYPSSAVPQKSAPLALMVNVLPFVLLVPAAATAPTSVPVQDKGTVPSTRFVLGISVGFDDEAVTMNEVRPESGSPIVKGIAPMDVLTLMD
jgi:hypothetical protein